MSNWSTLVGVLSETDAKVIISLLVAVPSILAGTAAVLSAQAKKQAAEANASLKRNGGSTPADGLYRIEQKLDDYGQRLGAIEDYITNPKDHQ